MAGGIPNLPLSLGSKNIVVSEFKDLIDNKLGDNEDILSGISTTVGAVNKIYSSTVSLVNSVSSSSIKDNSGNIYNTSLSTVNTFSELNKELYDKATSLPDSGAVSLNKLSDAAKHNFGKFSGGNVYVKNASSEFVIDSSNRNVQSTAGWVTPLQSYPDYFLLTNNAEDSAYYIQVKDFTPDATVEDFSPLYDKVKNDNHINDDTVLDNTKSATSVAASKKEDTSSYVNSNNGTKKDLVKSDGKSDSAKTNELKKWKDLNIENISYIGIYPKQIGVNKNTSKNDSVYNNVQAVVYDLPNTNPSSTMNDSINMLLCYQQPENISYTAAAQFDQAQVRGTQQPFQFYQNANYIELSFELKWHIDEIRTLSKDGVKSYTIQDIAQIAEDFTRPWSDGQSLHPKVCKVILPGVSHIGYITQAQITYGGDMSGDYTTGMGVLSGSGENITEKSIYNYFYSTIDVSFQMIIIKDIVLLSANDSRGISMRLYTDDDQVSENKDTTKAEQQSQEQNNSLPSEEAKETENKSSEQESPQKSVAEANASMEADSINGSVNSSQPPTMLIDTVKNTNWTQRYSNYYGESKVTKTGW